MEKVFDVNNILAKMLDFQGFWIIFWLFWIGIETGFWVIEISDFGLSSIKWLNFLGLRGFWVEILGYFWWWKSGENVDFSMFLRSHHRSYERVDGRDMPFW